LMATTVLCLGVLGCVSGALKPASCMAAGMSSWMYSCEARAAPAAV
jgi:hypothetical protein